MEVMRPGTKVKNTTILGNPKCKLSENHNENFQLALLFEFSTQLYIACKTIMYYNKVSGKRKKATF